MSEIDDMIYNIDEAVDLIEGATPKGKTDDGTRILVHEDGDQSKVLVVLGDQVVVVDR